MPCGRVEKFWRYHPPAGRECVDPGSCLDFAIEHGKHGRASSYAELCSLMPNPRKFSHLDVHGSAAMVDVGRKAVVFRRATAVGKLLCAPATIRLLKKKALPKGDVLGV